MDNSIGTMFTALLQAAMNPLLERIEHLENENALINQELVKQDKVMQAMEVIVERVDTTQPFANTPAGVMEQLMLALNDGAGPYREFCQFVEDSIQESNTICSIRESLPGDTNETAKSLFENSTFRTELIDFLEFKDFPTEKRVLEMIDEVDAGLTESDAREFANEEIDSRKFVSEDDVDEKINNLLKDRLEDVTVTLSLD